LQRNIYGNLQVATRTEFLKRPALQNHDPLFPFSPLVQFARGHYELERQTREIFSRWPPVTGKFYLHGGKEFSKESVLNSRLEKPLLLRAGQVVEGMILACGLERIPDSVQHGSRPPCNLVLIDQVFSTILPLVPRYVLAKGRLRKSAFLSRLTCGNPTRTMLPFCGLTTG
jgi:hypothetical protein